MDGSQVASRERPALPGRNPGSRRVTLPLDLRVPGEGLPPGMVPGVERSPGKVLGWRTGTVTRGGSVLFLHYRDQAVNAGDDGPAPGKSTACLAYLRCSALPSLLRFAGWWPGGPPPWESSETTKRMQRSVRRLTRHVACARVAATCGLSLQYKRRHRATVQGLDPQMLGTQRARLV